MPGLESPGYRRSAPLRHMPDDRVQHCQPRHLRSGGETLPERLALDRLHLHGAAEFVVNQRGRTVAAKRKAALDLPVGKRIGNRVPEPARGIEQLIHERTRLRTQRRIKFPAITHEGWLQQSATRRVLDLASHPLNGKRLAIE